jgi:uncharacterized protein YndB with AHSA1/START domain
MTSEAPDRGDVAGSLRAGDGAGIVRIESRHDCPVEDLWSALTEPDRVARWYGEVDGDLRPGGQFRLHVPVSGWYGTGQVLECDAPHRLVVTTRETDESHQAGQGAEPFDNRITATVRADAGRTGLALEISGLPLDKIQFYGAGWQLHVETLMDYLAGRATSADESRFDALLPGYQALAAELR